MRKRRCDPPATHAFFVSQRQIHVNLVVPPSQRSPAQSAVDRDLYAVSLSHVKILRGTTAVATPTEIGSNVQARYLWYAIHTDRHAPIHVLEEAPQMFWVPRGVEEQTACGDRRREGGRTRFASVLNVRHRDQTRCKWADCPQPECSYRYQKVNEAAQAHAALNMDKAKPSRPLPRPCCCSHMLASTAQKTGWSIALFATM